MFEKEFEDKLKESVNTPRDHDFDEGAWASLEQQLEILSAATGTSLSAGLKGAALWGVKSWMATAAAVVLLGTSVYFYTQWQETKQEVAELKTNPERLKADDFGEKEVDGSSEMVLEVPGSPTTEAFSEAKESDNQGSPVSPIAAAMEPLQVNPAEAATMAEESMEDLAPEDETVDLYASFAVEPAAPVYLDIEPRVKAEAPLFRLLPAIRLEDENRIRHPLRLAIEASLNYGTEDSLQTFQGKSIGLRPEFWVNHKLAFYAGILQQSGQAVFTDSETEPISAYFPPLPGPLFREDRLTNAVFDKKELIMPMGLKYAPFHNHLIKVFTGIGITLQKDLEKEISLSYLHQDNFPQWGPREWTYDVRFDRDPGKLRLSQASLELGVRVYITRQAELELAYTYLQDISGDSTLFVRDQAHKISSALIFSF